MAEERASQLPIGGTPAEMPAVDDHLATPNTREEWFDGELRFTEPAEPPDADCKAGVCYVIRGCAAQGYAVTKDLLTRVDVNSDFGTGISVLRSGNDPRTGRRYLEEICFEVGAQDKLDHFGARAVKLLNRGVRRCFVVLPREQEVREWAPDAKAWVPLAPEEAITDPALTLPLPVVALLDRDAADGAVFLSLWQKRTPALVEIAEEDPARLLALLIWYKFRPSDEATLEMIRDTISSADRPSLLRWADRVVSAGRIMEIFVDG